MATKKVTQLPAAVTANITGTSLVPVVDALGNSVKATLLQILSGISAVTSLTGDVTGSGGGALATTIAALAVTTGKLAAHAVTFAKMQTISSGSLLGRSTAGTGDVEELTLAATLTLSGGVLGVTPGGTAFHGVIMQQRFGGF